jgi:hypothetical protein
MISLRPPKRVLEQRGTSLRTAVDARIDGGDVNLVTTSASGELQNHPEAQIKLPWVRRLQNFIPSTKPKNFPEAQPDPRRQRPNSFDIPVAIPRAIFFPCRKNLATELSEATEKIPREKFLLFLFVAFCVFRGRVFQLLVGCVRDTPFFSPSGFQSAKICRSTKDGASQTHPTSGRNPSLALRACVFAPCPLISSRRSVPSRPIGCGLSRTAARVTGLGRPRRDT